MKVTQHGSCFALCLWILATPAQAQPDQRCLDATKVSVARVTARLNGQSSVSTAFFHPDDSHAITTLHSVSRAESIQIRLRRADGTIFETTARVIKTLPGQDLAVLALQEPAGAPALRIAPERVNAGESLVALGFPRASAAVMADTVSARRTDQYGALGSYVPSEVRRELQKSGDLLGEDSEVLNLEGALRPGNSGCPIVNTRCEVVAIGNGGIDQGTTSWSWGIPAAGISRLHKDATANQPDVGQAGGIRFSTISESDVAREVSGLRLGGEPFVFTQTRKLGDIRTSAAVWNSDDPLGLAQILFMIRTSIPGFDPDDIKLDIYSHLASGAALTLPAGLRLQPDGTDFAKASLAGGAIEVLSGFFNRPDLTSLQRASVEFESHLVPPPPKQVQIDPEWSYMQFNPQFGTMVPSARTRYDGLIFNRKAVYIYEAGDFGIPISRGYIFETLATRGRWLLGSSARALKSIEEIAADRELASQWAAAVVSVHLTSFK